MAKKFSIFNYLEKKVENAPMKTITQSLLDQLAFKELALYIGISYIANTLSKCEFKVFENGEEVKNELYYKLNVSPNVNQNSSQFINKFVENYYYNGHSLIVKNNDSLYCADSFDVDDTNPLKENTFNNITFNCQQLKRKYKASEVYYLQLDNRKVKALIDNLYMEYGKIISIALASYKRTNSTKYKLLLEQYQAGDPKFQEYFNDVISKQLEKFINAESSAVYPQYKSQDLQVLESGTLKDTTDIITMRKEVFEVVAQALKIPLSMMYGNITNMTEIVKVYLSICIDPLACMIEEEITRKYYTFTEWKKGCYVKLDTSCINHVDVLEVADNISKAVSSGVVNVDNLRNRLDMPLLNTDFSKAYFMTKNFALATEIMNGLSNEGVMV